MKEKTMLKWVINGFDVTPKQWIPASYNNLIKGEPKKTDSYTVKKLIRIGVIGYYREIKGDDMVSKPA